MLVLLVFVGSNGLQNYDTDKYETIINAMQSFL